MTALQMLPVHLGIGLLFIWWAWDAAFKRGQQSGDAAYWKRAYEMLVEQTGRDLNDGLGHDPRKTQAPKGTTHE